MAIVTKKKVQAAQGAGSETSTHFPNETTKPAKDSDQAVVNNQDPNKLYDPDELGVPGSTHFNNDETFSEKSNRMNGGKTTASAKKATTAGKNGSGAKHKPVPLAPTSGKKHPAKATTDPDGSFPFGDEDSGVEAGAGDGPGSDPDRFTDDFGDGERASVKSKAAARLKAAKKLKADAECETGQQDTQHMANDEDPAAGYLTADLEDLEDSEEDEGMDGDGEEVDAEFEDDNEPAELEDDAGSTPQSLLEVDDGWNPDEEEHPEIAAEFDDVDGSGISDEEDDDDEIEATTKPVTAAADSMAIVDIDGTDDEGDDVVFATIGTRVHAIKANRIVASIGKKLAVKAGHGDMYLSDEFQTVTEAEMSKHGLRAGLRKMGFALASVNVAGQDVLNKRVEAKANKVTAAIRRSTQSQQASLEQCLAIAAVGVTRGRFQDVENTLLTAMVSELQAAGVRGAGKLVRRVFANHGVDYSKSILTIANKLSSMPEQVRNSFAEALNMTTAGVDMDEGVDESDELFGDSASPDFQSQFADADGETEFNDEFEDEFESPETVQAALANPAIRRTDGKKSISAKRAGYSVSAAAVLAGDAPLPFSI